MDIVTGSEVAKTVLDLAKNENVLNKSVGALGMLFPFAGIKQKAVEMYIEEIEKSDLPIETKVYLVLNMKKAFKKIKNQTNIVEIATKSAKQGTDFTDNSGVSEEWLDRFMDSAGFVSSEEMQLIWGKILASEFENPGSTPPNMIRILSEITPSLAKAFRLICSMTIWIMPLNENGDIQDAVQKMIVPYNVNDDKFREIGVNFNVLNELEALGVIRFDSLAGYISKGITNDTILICVGDKIDKIIEHEKDQFPIGNVIFTSVGEVLKSITDSVEINDYYEMIKQYLNYKGVKFAEEHEYYTEINGDKLTIHRKDIQ